MSEPTETPKQKNWFARHKILSVILAIILIAIIASASGSSSNKSSDSKKPGTPTTQGKTAAIAKIGQSASDGKFEFTVNKFSCGEKTVGTNQYLQKNAQGQFCRLNVTVKNKADQAQMLSSSDQFLLDSANKKYSADDQATIYAEPSDQAGSTWFENINPGNSVTGDMIFDVPAGTTPTTAELHDSAFSGGVKVSLQ